MNRLKAFLFLPPLDTEFERQYLQRLNWISLWILVAHLPVFLLFAWLNETGMFVTGLLTSLALVGPILGLAALQSQRQISVVMGVCSMFMGGILVHIGQGPMQIEMHFYFFVMLALLSVYGNPIVILAAAGTVSLHHLILWVILPTSVFNYSAPFWIVGVHAGFVVLESAAACFIARNFHDSTIHLEKSVALRTLEVENANGEIRQLLDSVQQGFLKLDCFGRIGSKYSRAVVDLLGEIPASKLFTELLARHDRAAAEWFQMGLDDVYAGIMPLELTLDQLPKQIKSESRFLSLTYAPIFDAEELTNIVVVVSDVTAVVEREKLEVESRDFLSIIDRIASDQVAFLEFFAEAETLINRIRDRSSQDDCSVARDIHTLKGNASIFGLVRIANACHAIEDYIAENSELPCAHLWTELFQSWASTRGNLRRLISDTEVKVTLGDEEYKSVLLSILNNAPKYQLAMRVAAWRLEPTQRRLQIVAEQITSLGVRLGKGVNVLIHDNGLRTDPKHWAKFWCSLIHVIRNSVDHGIESREQRLAMGKSELGTITLSTAIENSKYVVTVKDDGCGIDWERIRQKAVQAGLPSSCEEDLKEALFRVGISSREVVTETSGRGVGMAAIQESCRSFGGAIEIQSIQGEGTQLRFVFPVESMAQEMHALLRKYGIENTSAITCNAIAHKSDVTRRELDCIGNQ